MIVSCRQTTLDFRTVILKNILTTSPLTKTMMTQTDKQQKTNKTT